MVAKGESYLCDTRAQAAVKIQEHRREYWHVGLNAKEDSIKSEPGETALSGHATNSLGAGCLVLTSELQDLITETKTPIWKD